MRFTLSVFLTVLTVTSGLAGNDSPKEEASLTWTGGHTTGKVTVVIDGYTHNSTLTSGDSVPLGTQIILVCRVVGLPYGTPLNYTWTCPNEPCEVEGYYGRKVYNEHILAVNTTSRQDRGTYTCQVTPTGGQEATGSFTLKIRSSNSRVVHSYGRLIPYQFPITHPHQISYLIREGLHGYRVTCNVTGRPAPWFATPNGTLGTVEVTQVKYQRSAILDVNVSTFQNRDMYCVNRGTNYFYLYLTSADNIPAPGVNVPRVTSSQVDYETTAHGSATRVIAGYEVTRFGVPMIGQYVNTGRGRRVTISPAVPGAQYRITAWALGDGRRSATPAVVNVTTREADPSPPRNVTITRVFQDGVELNWLPPTEPNGEVHYVVEYKREDSGNWTSVNTTSDSTHYNLTGLHSGTSYTIRVVAVKGAGQTSNIPTASSTATPPASSTATPTASSTATPPASSTATPPASSTATPPASSTATPPASSTATPPASSTPTHPNSSTASPTASSTATHTTSLTSGPLNLPAVLAGALVAFLLLTLLIAGIIVGVVLLGRANRRGKRIEKRRKSIELIECVEKREEIVEVSLAGTSSTGNDSERQINDNLVYHYERTQPYDEPCYKSVDVAQQSVDGKGSRSKGYNYIVVEAVKKSIHSKEEVGVGVREMGQQSERPRGNPNAVYAVVDKSKKRKHKKTQGGASATTTQGADTEEQHYECSTVLGQDWFGNVLKVSHGDGGQESLSNDAMQTGPKSEPCNPGAVYAVVDKSKKGNKGKKNSE